MTQQQLNDIREMFSTNPLTGAKVEGTLPAPAFSANSKPCTLGLNFDIDRAIQADDRLSKIYQEAHSKYSGRR